MSDETIKSYYEARKALINIIELRDGHKNRIDMDEVDKEYQAIETLYGRYKEHKQAVESYGSSVKSA